MITNTNEPISSPEKNQVVFFKPWEDEKDKRKKAYPVIINEGQFFSNGAISNFWYWQRITPTGKIKPKIEHGYGNFTIAIGYSAIITNHSTITNNEIVEKIERTINIL